MKRLSYIIVWVLIGLNPTYAASRTSINIENDITTTVESHLPEDSIPRQMTGSQDGQTNSSSTTTTQ